MKKYFFCLLILSAAFLVCNAQVEELRRRGAAGGQIAPLPDDLKTRLKIKNGVLVEAAVPQSAAEAAGLQRGDVILKAGDVEVATPDEFVALVRRFYGGDRLNLLLNRDGREISKTLTLKPRPQETHPDFDILYRTIVSNGVRRRVIVTKPKGEGKRNPALLFLAGVGCYSQDNLSEDSVHRKIFYALTQKGFVTMRVEKSGMGDSEGADCMDPSVDFETETAAYIEGLKALKSYDFVDPAKVFLFGHSMGGISAPLVASNQTLAGIIVAGTVGKSWFEYELENLRRQMLLGGASNDAVEREVRQKEYCNYRLYRLKETPEQISKDAPYCFTMSIQPPAPYTYMRQVADLNLAEKWKNVNAPVLVIYGSSDYLTSAEEHKYLTAMLNKYRPGSAWYLELPNTDHGFASVPSQAEAFQRARRSESPGEFNVEVLKKMEKWLFRKAEIIFRN
jgi:Trypsin-like serine proteases, typically periplasmic, contain C-terminal PDZ domain